VVRVANAGAGNAGCGTVSGTSVTGTSASAIYQTLDCYDRQIDIVMDAYFDKATHEGLSISGFVAGIGDIDISIALQKRIKGAFWGGEGLILEKIAGQGVVFIHAGGELVSFDLTPGETIQVDTGSAVAWDESVVYDVRRVKSLKTALFGGEGIFLTSLTGPGTVIIQTMTLSKLRCQIGQTSSESKK
jgi:hypothetical protein